jgi:hypothetical protein
MLEEGAELEDRGDISLPEGGTAVVLGKEGEEGAVLHGREERLEDEEGALQERGVTRVPREGALQGRGVIMLLEGAGRGVLGRNSPPLSGSVLITAYTCHNNNTTVTSISKNVNIKLFKFQKRTTWVPITAGSH